MYVLSYIVLNCSVKVALQFPDHLLKDSVNIASILSKESGQDVYILGDTSYGR